MDAFARGGNQSRIKPQSFCRSHLKPGMIPEGTGTNVANFGSFVDIRVHQEGLVHVSQLADHSVKDPSTLLKGGDVVKVAWWGVVARMQRGLAFGREEAVEGGS